MERLCNLFRTRLALRAAAIILLIVGLSGLVFLVLAVDIGERREQRAQHVRLQELLSTVENTAQIACFLGDVQLAEEVANGLLSNRVVSRVTVLRGDEVLLARGQPAVTGTEPLVRAIHSPFDPAEQVCRIALTPNQAEIDRVVTEASGFIAGALALQLIGIGVSVVLVVLHFVTRPITRISHRLHELEAETGQKLEAPRSNHRDEIGQLVTSVNAMIDHLVETLREERRLRLRREVEERRFRTIFDNVETGIFELDAEGRVISANPAFKRLFQLPETSDPSVQPLMLASLVSEGMPAPYELAERSSAQGAPVQLELALPDGALKRWVSVLLSRIEEGRLQGVAHDITDRKLATDAAERLAMTDTLTGLGNRLGFERRLAAAASLHQHDPDYRLALLLLDLDHFKATNDTLGHIAGDRVLQHVGELLSDLVRKSDYVARLGGDEFVVLLEGLGSREVVTSIVERFMQRVSWPIEVGGDDTVRIGASVGIALLGLDTSDEDELVQLADRAMYRAKMAGRDTYRFYGTG